jgi:SAM-dependent methyltransferase
VRTALGYIHLAGIDPLRMASTLRGLRPYLTNLGAMRRALAAGSAQTQSDWPINGLFPCLSDRFEKSGVASGHYFHQDLLISQHIFKRQPEKHVDVGSRTDGFVAHVASFREIEVLDFRPLTSTIENVSFRVCDLMAPLPDQLKNFCDSLSCLHALEHFGLGRYGDPIRPNGHVVGLANLHEILREGGTLYLSVPMGPQRIEFDAHRVFGLSKLLDLVEHGFDIMQFSYVDDAGDLQKDVALKASQEQVSNNFGCHYGCAILTLRKRSSESVTWPI